MKNNTQDIRLYYDILFSGPTYIWYGLYIKDTFFKSLLILFGIATMLLNYSYYMYNKGQKTIYHDIISIKILGYNSKNNNGSKTQFVRLSLLLFWYPLILYSLYKFSNEVPVPLKYLTFFKVLVGYMYNLKYFILKLK
jgi:hypothetical protein